jgi:hypothetical protein
MIRLNKAISRHLMTRTVLTRYYGVTTEIVKKVGDQIVKDATGKSLGKMIDVTMDNAAKTVEEQRKPEDKTVERARAIGNLSGRAIVFGLYGVLEGVIKGVFNGLRRLVKRE